jgi:integrase
MSTHPRPRVPSYRLHKQSGQAVVTLPDGRGGRRDVLLGKYDTPESKAEYQRVLLQWEAAGRHLPGPEAAADLTVAELIERFWRWSEGYYRRADGSPTSQVDALRHSLRPLNYLFGPTPARDFGPAALKAVRDLLVKGYDHPRYGPQVALCRAEVNKRVKHVRRLFKWGVAEGLVGATILWALQAVEPLKRGRTEARESKPVLPVARAVVEETLPVLPSVLADMVQLQLETGMRPGELVIMRAIDIDMAGPVWLYRPAAHKTQHHGHERVIPIGPKGQEIVRRHLKPNVEAYLFSPADSVAAFRARSRQERKSKVPPSQRDRRKKHPRKKPGCRYTTRTFGATLHQAIERHNRKAPADRQIPHWHPHQLRHTRALELKREFGLDVARAVLGHKSPVIAEHYATLDVGRAAEAMAKIG